MNLRMTTVRRELRAGAVLIAFSLAGCYQHVPVSLDYVRPSERVRISLTPSAAEQLHESVGLGKQTVTARLAANSPTSVSLLIPSAYGDLTRGSRDLYQHVMVTPTDVLSVHRLRLDRRRTGFVAATAAVATAAIVMKIFSGETGATPLAPGVPSAEALMPF